MGNLEETGGNGGLGRRQRRGCLPGPELGCHLGGWGLLGGYECMLLDGVQHIQELDLGGECVAMVDDREIVWAIPAVH